jgi:hypothetical protein
MDKEKYIKLLDQKLHILLQILEITQQTIIFCEGDEEFMQDEAEKFSALYESREAFISQIGEIDKTLLEYKGIDNDAKLAKAQKPILDKMKEAAGKIVEFDRKNIEVSAKINGFLKEGLKAIRNGQEISSAYANFHGATSGRIYDSAK